MSMVGVYDAEWRKRKINLFSVLRSFVSQLSPGQELTKVSLPSELCHPFSMLELVAHRELQLFQILFQVNQETDPIPRFLAVVRWYLGLVREETMEKKPFNPVIGETHLCWVDGGVEIGISEFIGEQVSHHPPVSAFIVQNQKQNISITGDVTFKVGFGSNCASVSTGGEVMIHTSLEDYKMTKCVPDMMVNNVIWGEKYLIWNGAVNITCSANQLSANIRLFEVEGRNLLEGEILDNGVPIYHLSGVAGKKTYFHEPGSDEKKLLVDISTYTDSVIQYLPEEVQTELNSLKLWMPVKQAIVRNDMVAADEEKKKIEADQRMRQNIRKTEGTWKDAKYFIFHPKDNNAYQASIMEEEELVKGTWEFKKNVSIDREFIESLYKEAEEIRQKKTAEKGLQPQHQNEIHENNDSCSVQ